MTHIFSVDFEECSFRLPGMSDNSSVWCCINYGSISFKSLIEDLAGYIVQLNAENNLQEKIKENFPIFSSPMNFLICLPSQNVSDNPILNLNELRIVKNIFLLAKFLQETYGFGENIAGKFHIVGENLSPILNGLVGLIRILNREWSLVDSRFNNNLYYEKNLQVVEENFEKPTINAQDVFLVTAGARGITAQCCLKLAKETRCSFILLGRTSLNLGRFEKLRYVENTHELMLSIKTVLMEDAEKVTPKEVQVVFKKIQIVRDIENTLREFELLGSRVQYYECDITQANELNAVTANYAEAWGSITGIIHGAGNLVDKLIKDETEEDIDAVILPKVKGLFNLIHSDFFAQVKWCVIFSSVSSLYGNKGQSAYAVANEILNQASVKMNALYPHCKTIALCWGAWELGMVNTSLKSVFEKRGISLLTIDEGTQLFWRSLTVNYPYVILDKNENMQKRLQEHHSQTCLFDRQALENMSLKENFDQRLRLPAPPFLFVSRILKISKEKKPGCVGEMWFEYDVPQDTLFQSCGKVHEFVLAESCHAVAILAYVLLEKEVLSSPSALRGSNGSIEFYSDNLNVGEKIQCHVRVEAVLPIPAGKLLKQVFVGSCNTVTLFKIESYAAVINPEKIQPTVLMPPSECLVQKKYEFFAESDLQQFYRAWNVCHFSSELLSRVKIYPSTSQGSVDIVVGEFDLSENHWVFSAHFVNDPLFPASLMHFALFQLLFFYAATKKLCSASHKVKYARDIKTKRKLIHSLYPCHETVYFHLEINSKNASRIIAKAFVYLDKLLLAEYENIGIEWNE